MSWYRIKITFSGAGPLNYLVAVQPFLFDAELAILKAGDPVDLGLFASQPANGKQYFYLPPTTTDYCRQLLDLYQAEAVEMPDPMNIREVADNQTKNAFGVWFPEFTPKLPNLLFRTYRHVPVSDPDDDLIPLQEYRLVWQDCNHGLARRFYVPGFTGHLPFFLSGAQEMKAFDSNGPVSLNEKQLLKGILWGLYEMSQAKRPWHKVEYRDTYLYLLDVLGQGFGFNDSEKLILNTAASCRDINGSAVSRQLLLTGLDLIPFSSKIRSDLICDTWAVAAETNDPELLRSIPEWVMETTLSTLLKRARENICYYGFCAMVKAGFDTDDVEAYLRDFVYPNIRNQLLKVKIGDLLVDPESHSIKDLKLGD